MIPSEPMSTLAASSFVARNTQFFPPLSESAINLSHTSSWLLVSERQLPSAFRPHHRAWENHVSTPKLPPRLRHPTSSRAFDLLVSTFAPSRRSCLGTRFSSFRQLPIRVLLSSLDPYHIGLRSHPFRESPHDAALWVRTLHAPYCISHFDRDRGDSSHALT